VCAAGALARIVARAGRARSSCERVRRYRLAVQTALDGAIVVVVLGLGVVRYRNLPPALATNVHAVVRVVDDARCRAVRARFGRTGPVDTLADVATIRRCTLRVLRAMLPARGTTGASVAVPATRGIRLLLRVGTAGPVLTAVGPIASSAIRGDCDV